MLTPTTPYTVPADIEVVHLVVTGVNDPLPPAAMALTHRSPAPIGLRLAGGCSNMTPDDKQGMLDYLGAGLADFRGLISSGGTRQVTEHGLLDPMVTDVPALLVAQNPSGVIAISTLPRTADLGLVDESRLILSHDGHTLPNPGVHMLIVVQSHDGSELDWDGDLRTYFNFFGNLVRHGGWRFGTIVYNGGGVTEKEAMTSAQMGWPVIIVEGSGRAADKLAQRFYAGELDPNFFAVVRNNHVAQLQDTVYTNGLLAA